MNILRTVSALLVVSGLAAGTLEPTEVRAAPRRTEGYLILAADFHVHAFPGDGAFAPWILRREVERAGLDVFALTNHNRVFTAQFGRWLAAHSHGAILLVGEEITSRRYHLIAVGIDDVVDSEQPASAAIEAVHRQGGVAIAAHPEAPSSTDGYDDRALASLDGVERAHPVMRQRAGAGEHLAEFYRRAQQLHPGIAAIGSSDFHVTSSPGDCRTYVLARELSAASVVEAIREGRTVAADFDGRLYGDPRLVKIVVKAGGFIPPKPASRWRRFSVWCALLGLTGLVVFGTTSE